MGTHVTGITAMMGLVKFGTRLWTRNIQKHRPMNTLALTALTLCVLFGMPARQAFPADIYDVQGHIGTVIVQPSGDFGFVLKENVQLCNGAAGNTWITVNKNYVTAEGIKNLLSTVLSAKLAGRTVEVRAYTGEEWACRLEELWVLD